MAIAEHEITSQEGTQSVTILLTEAQAATLRQAATASGQSMEEFAAIVLASATAATLMSNGNQIVPPAKSFASVLGIFRDEPLMDDLMERIREERAKQAEQESK